MVIRQYLKKLTITLFAIMLAACQASHEQIGMLTGAALGGALGSTVKSKHSGRREVAIILGTIAGAMIGGSIGSHMDKTDRLYAQNAFETAPTHQATSWQNPDNGNEYTVTPTRTYEVRQQPCRDYTIEAYINGRPETIHGTACRDEDGNWRTEG